MATKMLGKSLEKEGLSIVHIDNPVLFDRFESNASYIRKIDDSIDVLVEFREDLKGYSSLLSFADSTIGGTLLRITFPILSFVHHRLRANLLSSHPSLLALRFYKLYLLLSQLCQSQMS